MGAISPKIGECPGNLTRPAATRRDTTRRFPQHLCVTHPHSLTIYVISLEHLVHTIIIVVNMLKRIDRAVKFNSADVNTCTW